MGDLGRQLVVVCDFQPSWWACDELRRDCFKQCVESVLIFCNSYLMMKHTNRLAFVVSHPSSSSVLFPLSPLQAAAVESKQQSNDGKYEQFVEMNESVMKKMKQLCEDPEELTQQPTLLAGALMKALCFIHNSVRSSVESGLESRLLIVKGGDEAPSQYMTTMNCLFAAQKEKVVIDACSLAQDSGFLQQAADITGGTYLKVERLPALLEYLLWNFLPSASFRSSLDLPRASSIDYRAACFCHKKLVDVGFVCSVCLSIYCQFMPRCSTCSTRFKLPALPSTAKAKKKKKEAQ